MSCDNRPEDTDMRFVALFTDLDGLNPKTFKDVGVDKEGSIRTDVYGISREEFLIYTNLVAENLLSNPDCLLLSREENADERKGTVEQFAALVVQDLLEAVTIWGGEETDFKTQLQRRIEYYAGNVRITYNDKGRIFFVKRVSPEWDFVDNVFVGLLCTERQRFWKNMEGAGIPDIETSRVIFHLDEALALEEAFRMVGSASSEMLTFEGPRAVYYNNSKAYWRERNVYSLFDSRFLQALWALTVVDWRLTTGEFGQHFSWAASPLMDPTLLTLYLTVLDKGLTAAELTFLLIDAPFYYIFASPDFPDIGTIHNGQTPITNKRNCSLDDPYMWYYTISVMRNLIESPLGYKLRRILNVQMAEPKYSFDKRNVCGDEDIAQFFLAMLYRRFLIKKMRQEGMKLLSKEKNFLHQLNERRFFFAARIESYYISLFPEEEYADEI